MKPRNAVILVLSILLCGLVPQAAFAAADVVTVGSVSASGTSVDVPVYIRDVAGTPLGMDKPAGSKIQSYSIKVNYAPASAVSSVTFTRDGITGSLTPASEFSPATTGSISLLDTFSESSNPIPFTLNKAAPGDKVANLHFTLSGSATPGTTITLTLDGSLTQLTDQGGSAATKETVGNGSLALSDGQITIAPITVSLTPGSRNVPVGGTGSLAAVLSAASASSTVVSLSSSTPSVATVPASVTIPAGQLSGTFNVTGVSIGTSTITATLGSSTGTSTVNVVDTPVVCTPPVAPALSGPVTATAGQPYTINWNTVLNASEYIVDESTDAAFTNPSSRTLATTTATYVHSSAGKYYYRVKARNHVGTCDVSSDFSTSISIQLTPAPSPPMRILAVVGSVPGSFGSYFRTSVQLYNPRESAVSGKIVFHPSGVAGSAADPSLAYSIQPGKTLAYTDLLPAMGVASGIGSADIIADASSGLPIALVRVFNDGGAAGTTGLAEDALPTDKALFAGSRGVLIAPSDVTRFRLNIGVRSLDSGASMTVMVRDKDGNVVKTTQKTYDPTYFLQAGSAGVLDGYVLTGGETITFDVTAGSAFVYGSITDNTTNDPSVQFAAPVE